MERRLLILDDDPLIGQTIQRIAEFAGLGVRFTTDPEEFFRFVDQWQPSHIALDLVMPEMDGVQVMTRLAERGCRARIVLTSGVGSRVLDAAGRSAAEHGLAIAGVLSKPFSSVALRNLLLHSPDEEQASAPRPLVNAAQTGQPVAATREMLSQALEEGALYPVYQPRVECRTGQLSGFEVLARWRHAEHGFIQPDRFIKLAENAGLIDNVSEQIFSQALQWFAAEFAHGSGGQNGEAVDNRKPVTLSLNLSARSLTDSRLTERLAQWCTALKVRPDQVILELTETSAMDDPISSLNLLTRLRMQGFHLSIDDFGTGYSSMLQLVRLPFSEIKIDKSFVSTAMQSQESRAVVRSVVTLGQSLGLRSTAEGVEDGRTLDYLRDIGCDLAQGYYVGRPMRGEDVAEWTRSRDSH